AAAEGELLGAIGTATLTQNATLTFESTGGGIAVKCPSSEGSLTYESSTKGSFDDLHLGCTAGGFKCTGLTDSTAGSILVKGAWEVLAFKEGASLKLALVYVLSPVHFECLGILTEIRGGRIGLIDNANGIKTTKITALFTGSSGKESITEVNGVNHHLESSTGGSAFVEDSVSQNVTATGVELEVMY